MALPNAIKVQPSRFAALNLDSDSDSGDSGNEWFEVVGGKATSKPKGKEGGSNAPQEHKDGPSGGRSLSKSAKKRARRKRNQQSLSESKGAPEPQAEVLVDDVSVKGEDEELKLQQQREAAMADIEFQRELEEALLQSRLTAEQEQEIDRQRKAAAALKKHSKRGVKISLQSLHRGGDLVPESEVRSPKGGAVVNDDSAFFEHLGHEVESGLKKRPERKISESQMSPVEESARVAHVMDELEKREKIIKALREENDRLKSEVKEVKERNKQLCKILGQGECESA
jgi:hypothetical protein